MAQRMGRATDATTNNAPRAQSAGPAVQLEQSFLDRLMSLSTAGKDQEYRQGLTDRVISESERLATLQREAAFYEDLVSNVPKVGSRAVGAPETVALINTRTNEAFNEVSKAVDQISALYNELSARNLNPSATLYSVTGPFTVRVSRGVTSRTVALYVLLGMTLALILTPVGCLLHDALRRPQPRQIVPEAAARRASG